MRLTGIYGPHSAMFEALLGSYFVNASRADRQRLAIAFCKGVDAANGAGLHDNKAGQVDSSKSPPPTRIVPLPVEGVAMPDPTVRRASAPGKPKPPKTAPGSRRSKGK
jgi:hypothetical protein